MEISIKIAAKISLKTLDQIQRIEVNRVLDSIEKVEDFDQLKIDKYILKRLNGFETYTIKISENLRMIVDVENNDTVTILDIMTGEKAKYLNAYIKGEKE
ncbi:hypothetical protein [Priestia megaterium]|uniref:hypothetical protein n=1 Tax=Priestia megaterium TaxID=1404 RepID=UPI003D073B64